MKKYILIILLLEITAAGYSQTKWDDQHQHLVDSLSKSINKNFILYSVVNNESLRNVLLIEKDKKIEVVYYTPSFSKIERIKKNKKNKHFFKNSSFGKEFNLKEATTLTGAMVYTTAFINNTKTYTYQYSVITDPAPLYQDLYRSLM